MQIINTDTHSIPCTINYKLLNCYSINMVKLTILNTLFKESTLQLRTLYFEKIPMAALYSNINVSSLYELIKWSLLDDAPWFFRACWQNFMNSSGIVGVPKLSFLKGSSFSDVDK